MIPSGFAQQHNETYWYIPFVGSIHVRLHAETPAPLVNTVFSVVVSNDTGPCPWKGISDFVNVTINRQAFRVYHTDGCSFEGWNLLSNFNVTASKVFDVTVQTGTPNDNYTLFAIAGYY